MTVVERKLHDVGEDGLVDDEQRSSRAAQSLVL